MLTEAFRSVVPHLITTSFVAGFISAMGLSNLGGRIFWPLFSDWLAKRVSTDPFYGRRLTYSLMWGLGPLYYILVIGSIHMAVQGYSPVFCLFLFSLSVYGVISGFGGTAATRPALCGDLFGAKNVGIMTARQLSVVMPAAFLGPRLVGYFRQNSIREAILDLTSKTDDATFFKTFGAGKDQIHLLIQQKTVTINRLLEILPSHIPDPTPFMYDKTMFVMASLQGLALLFNLMLKPIPPKFHEKEIIQVQPSLPSEIKKNKLMGIIMFRSQHFPEMPKFWIEKIEV
jgi:hypothetical protein